MLNKEREYHLNLNKTKELPTNYIIMLLKTFIHFVTLLTITTLTSALLTKNLTTLLLYTEIYAFLLLPIIIISGIMKGTPSTFVLLLMVVLVSAAELILTTTANKLITK